MPYKQSWADRFRWSQKKWAQKYDAKAEAAATKPGVWIGTCLTFATVSEMMDDLQEGGFGINSKEPDLLRAGCNSFLISYLHHDLYRQLTGPLFQCESPLEVAIGLALYLVGKELCPREVGLQATDSLLEPHLAHSKLNALLIEPQKPIGDHRVDFLLTYRGKELDWVGKPRAQWKSHPFQSQLIVECDGHDFHEKTKEQAARDKKRDRALQDLGFKVFHFTGRQIWNDVFECAQEAVGSLLKDARRQIKANK